MREDEEQGLGQLDVPCTPCKRRRWYNEPTSSDPDRVQVEDVEEQEESASYHLTSIEQPEPSFLAWWRPKQQQLQQGQEGEEEEEAHRARRERPLHSPEEEEEVTSSWDSSHQPLNQHGKPLQQDSGAEPNSRSVVREERQDRQQQQSLLGFSFFSMAIAV
eukprot:CAMPEP_0202423592 /NCGR_PEP_ID=MMETSP1128-20130828/51460_1 /ASSEMBLY_ACC=CAM_ASM_000463 /TAXON_ID=3047 /ORGANISM="Dunaliella tertiolecta, Strain CCMP1320" /LENGTH=160 /DNA_ID=CAMNT_0049031705 /DNA_START=80 /DNA_END=565 /DNA_ORIENTATION=-